MTNETKTPSKYVAINGSLAVVGIYHEYTTGGPLDLLTRCGRWMGTRTTRESAIHGGLRLCQRCAAVPPAPATEEVGE